jgi:hypothetical protein
MNGKYIYSYNLKKNVREGSETPSATYLEATPNKLCKEIKNKLYKLWQSVCTDRKYLKSKWASLSFYQTFKFNIFYVVRLQRDML